MSKWQRVPANGPNDRINLAMVKYPTLTQVDHEAADIRTTRRQVRKSLKLRQQLIKPWASIARGFFLFRPWGRLAGAKVRVNASGGTEPRSSGAFFCAAHRAPGGWLAGIDLAPAGLPADASSKCIGERSVSRPKKEKGPATGSGPSRSCVWGQHRPRIRLTIRQRMRVLDERPRHETSV